MISKLSWKERAGLARDIARSVKQHYWDGMIAASDKAKKPKVINMLANDICNSKCAMCNIWQQKLDRELQPEEMAAILKDPLFSDVQSVGITGGEPTLREDLPELYRAVCKSLPKLRSMSIITNAIKDQDVIERITAIKKVLDEYGVKFSMMVSLDGYGEVHDAQRGRPGNFASAMRVINHFRNNTDIPVSIGCTLTKQNLYGADELLDFLIKEKLYGRFRIAEFIQRLYNDDLTESIRNFNAEERYHLAAFFKRLEFEFEPNLTYQRTYRNIIHMLMGGKRKIGCPYQDHGVVLDSRGDLLYCAPKSAVFGNALAGSALQAYVENIDERVRIKAENCEDCIHDYHAAATWPEYQEMISGFLMRKVLGIKGIPTWLLPKPRPILKGNFKQVFITGWYGTETVGDKAILGTIVRHYQQEFGKDGVKFIISAIAPFHTQRTLQELEIEAEIVFTSSRKFIDAAGTADITVMGGGPLMEMEALAIPLRAFQIAKRAGKKRVVFGCGLGPLHGQRYINATRDILLLADEVKIRDKTSIAWAERLTGRKDIQYSGDPAADFVIYRDSALPSPAKQPVLACFLREWSSEYKGEAGEEEFLMRRENFERNLAKGIKDFCREFKLKPAFYCMHTFVIGGDDRTFYRRFLAEHFSDMEYYLEERPSSVDQIIQAMRSSSYNLCMRFHSVLFANELNTNFFAIDYTNGGKITGFLTDRNKLDRMVPLRDIAEKDDFAFNQLIATAES